MRTPSVEKLMKTFNLGKENAEEIKLLGRLADKPAELAERIAMHHPKTDAWARACYNPPWSSRNWRRLMVLDAVSRIIGGYGSEPLSPDNDLYSMDWPPFEYVNMGDTYVTTLIYKRETDNLYVGCWGDIAEKWT